MVATTKLLLPGEGGGGAFNHGKCITRHVETGTRAFYVFCSITTNFNKPRTTKTIPLTALPWYATAR